MMVSKISAAVAAVVAVLFVVAGGGGGKRAGGHQMPASSASPKSIQPQVSLRLSQSLGTGGVGCARS